MMSSRKCPHSSDSFGVELKMETVFSEKLKAWGLSLCSAAADKLSAIASEACFPLQAGGLLCSLLLQKGLEGLPRCCSLHPLYWVSLSSGDRSVTLTSLCPVLSSGTSRGPRQGLTAGAVHSPTHLPYFCCAFWVVYLKCIF